MDLTMNQIIKRVDLILANVTKLNSIVNQTEIKKNILELNNMLNKVHNVGSKILNIYNICTNIYVSPIKTHSLNLTIDTIPNIPNNITNNNMTNTQLTYDIPVYSKTVNNIQDIPFTPLYWISNINQYAVNINGVILRGSIGNIYDKTHIQSNKLINQVVICKKNNLCKNVLNNEICKFYHDPEDLLKLVKLNTITSELFDKYKNLHRNYLNTDWIYTTRHSKNNNSMRHIGSRNTLTYDADLIKFNNNQHTIENFKQQCMHDILVVMGLNQTGLL